MQNRNQEIQTTYTRQYRTNDLTGKKFGMLTAVEPTTDRYYNSIVWLCRCDCGNEVLRSASQLKTGLKLSCGCVKRKADGHLEDHVTHVAGTTVELLKTPRIRSDNSTGVRGVNRFKDRYRAKIYFQGRNYSLGVYQTVEEAAAARKEAENCLYGHFLDFYDRWKEKADADPDWGKENPVSVSVKKDAIGRLRVSILPDLDGTADARMRSDPTISDYCISWLAEQEGKLSPLTYKRYRSTVDRHIVPSLGACLPSQLSKDRLDSFIKEKQGSMPVSTARTTLSILHTLLEYIDKKAPGQLPDLSIAYPQYAKKKLTLNEQVAILETLTNDMGTIKLGIFLALMTGMSVGEICALRWKDIVFIWHQIRIENNFRLVENDGKKLPVMEPTKRTVGEQVLPMTRLTTAYCKKFFQQDKDVYIMTGTREPMPPWTVNYRFRKLMKGCGLPGVRFDDLHDGFPEPDADLDFGDTELNEVLKKNLKKI